MVLVLFTGFCMEFIVCPNGTGKCEEVPDVLGVREVITNEGSSGRLTA
jgi:hypothetical protein